MPAFLIKLILDLVLSFGIPWIVAWLKKRFGVAASHEIVQTLSDYVEESKVDKKAARKRARERLRRCAGVACEPDTKGLG